MRMILTLALCVLAGVAQAQEPSAQTLRQGLAGAWIGALGYRDYQSDRLFELPVRTTIRALPDGVTLIQESAFDDGPSGTVYITTTSLDDPLKGTVTSATFRAGRDVTLSEEAVSVAAHVDATHWTLVYRETGEDDDQPAEIRVTQTRDGDALMSVKDVRPVGGDEAAWQFRNQTRLERSSAAQASLD